MQFEVSITPGQNFNLEEWNMTFHQLLQSVYNGCEMIPRWNDELLKLLDIRMIEMLRNRFCKVCNAFYLDDDLPAEEAKGIHEGNVTHRTALKRQKKINATSNTYKIRTMLCTKMGIFLNNIVSNSLNNRSNQKLGLLLPLITTFAKKIDSTLFSKNFLRTWAHKSLTIPSIPGLLSASISKNQAVIKNPKKLTVVKKQRITPQGKKQRITPQGKKRRRGYTGHLERKNRDVALATPVTSGPGFDMLQKMGWSPGEGGGKNKQGRADPVPIHSDNINGRRGLGNVKGRKGRRGK